MRLDKKYIFNILLVLAVTAVAMYFSLKDNFVQIMDAIGRMNPLMLGVVLLWGALITVVSGVAYMILGRLYKKDFSLSSGVIVAFVGAFFAGITPSSTGGQFGQIYILKKQGISYSDGASLLWADFVIYQTVMMAYVTVLFAARFQHYLSVSGWFWFIFVGYLLNFSVVFFLYTMVLFPKVYIWLSKIGAQLLGKMHILKNPEEQAHQWQDSVRHFTVEIKRLTKNKSVLWKCALVNVVRMTMYFGLPYLISIGLGIKLPAGAFIDTLALASFVIMANSFVPLPGASGGTEVFFTVMFKGMLGALTGAVMLLWRFSSYYIPVMLGAGVFLMFKTMQHHQHQKEQIHIASQYGQKNLPAEASDKTAAAGDLACAGQAGSAGDLASAGQAGLDAALQKEKETQTETEIKTEKETEERP